MGQQTRSSFTDIMKMWIYPTSIYFIIFCILTYPLILLFRTHFFTDTGDGLQNVWNIWWINKAVTELHQNPWHTNYLHYPHGTSLLGHTLNPFNGFIGIVLLKFMTLIETHNSIVLFSFTTAGLTSFWLAYYITKSYRSSIIAGFIFSFSQYHFMHAEGHLQLVSLELIPLFVLCWYRLLTKPNFIKSIITAIVLFGVLLCDYYYFFYCILTIIISMTWYAYSTKNFIFFTKREFAIPFMVLIFTSAITSGVLVTNLLLKNHNDPFLGEHDPLLYSLDLLAPFIPGGHWRFAELTEFYWSRLPGNINESSAYVGLSVVVLTCYAWKKRNKLRSIHPSFSLWYLIFFVFWMLSLGPAISIAGETVFTTITPYGILQLLFPPLELSGVPARMMVMVMLSASVISAMSLSILFNSTSPKRKYLGAVLGLVMCIEFLPTPIPSTPALIPDYVNILKQMPETGGVIDTITPPSTALYHQTIHAKPMADGYISRYPTSVVVEDLLKNQLIENNEYEKLSAEYGISYLVTDSNIDKTAFLSNLKLIHEASGVAVYAIKGRRAPKTTID